jgi:hypothetical protein
MLLALSDGTTRTDIRTGLRHHESHHKELTSLCRAEFRTFALRRMAAFGQHSPGAFALEDDLNPAYLSAFSALAGATIGGLTSFVTSWSTQRMQLRHAHREADRAKPEALYSDFIAEAARLFGDALTRQTEEITDSVRLSAMVGRMRLVSDRTVIDAARRVEETIIETYLAPNRTLHELRNFSREGGADFLTEFGEACRRDLVARATTVR